MATVMRRSLLIRIHSAQSLSRAAWGMSSALEAAACAAWLHGSAGDLAAAEIGEYGMTPGDLLTRLPRLLR